MIPEIKIYYHILLVFCICLLSCVAVKVAPEAPKNQVENTGNNVILTIKRRIPYCGGAAPSHEQANRRETEKNKNFVIQCQQGYGDSLWYKEFKTDSAGMIRWYLPDGKYCLKRAGKNIPFENFYKTQKKESDDFNLYRDRTCYYNWWKSCILTFELNDTIKTIETEVIINSRCFTGENPCHIYRGPFPP